MEILIKLDTRKKEAKALLEYIENLPFVKIEADKKRNQNTECYNPEFVAEIKTAEKSKKRYKIENIDEFWENI